MNSTFDVHGLWIANVTADFDHRRISLGSHMLGFVVSNTVNCHYGLQVSVNRHCLLFNNGSCAISKEIFKQTNKLQSDDFYPNFIGLGANSSLLAPKFSKCLLFQSHF